MFGWTLVRIDGDSMAPTLKDGDYILARLTSNSNAASLTTGRVILFDHDQLGLLVKRLFPTDKKDVFKVAGDNPASTSSEKLGDVSIEQINAIARWRISPNGLQRI